MIFFSLHVVPPTSIEIVGHPPGSRVKIQENEEVELTCKVVDAKPKADIVWYRKGSPFVTGNVYFLTNTKNLRNKSQLTLLAINRFSFD